MSTPHSDANVNHDDTTPIPARPLSSNSYDSAADSLSALAQRYENDSNEYSNQMNTIMSTITSLIQFYDPSGLFSSNSKNDGNDDLNKHSSRYSPTPVAMTESNANVDPLHSPIFDRSTPSHPHPSFDRPLPSIPPILASYTSHRPSSSRYKATPEPRTTAAKPIEINTTHEPESAQSVFQTEDDIGAPEVPPGLGTITPLWLLS